VRLQAAGHDAVIDARNLDAYDADVRKKLAPLLEAQLMW
jgi:hypothetical protein